MRAGRPSLVNEQVLVDVVLKNRQEVISERDDGFTSIVSETHSIWAHISEELSFKIKPGTIYSYIVNNKFNLRNLVFRDCNERVTAQNDDLDDSDNEASIATADLSIFSIVPKDKSDTVFIMTFGKSEFNDLIVETVRKYKDQKGCNKMRTINVLKPQKWTEIVSKRIFDDFNLHHGYHFKNHYISSDKQTGTFSGHCTCGSELKCQLLPRADFEELVKIECVASAGTADCGKRQCRGESRKRVVETLEVESTEMFRARKAAKLMKEGDSVEPPHLYSAEVLRTAKYRSQLKKFRDPHLIHAIAKFKKSGGENVIRDIGFDPFFVLFWSSHQIRVYNKIMRKNSCLCIDATGGIGKKIVHVDGSKSQHIFLYLGVLSSPNTNTTACGMLSEHQDTVSISTWLMRWIQSGAEYPKEVVCDSSKALLNACCITFTGLQSIICYAKACMSDNIPRCKIGIDVAHYINNWATFLSLEKQTVKKFYMFCIGQLILSRSQMEAAKIIEALLLISNSETAGNGAPSLKAAVDSMKKMITEMTPEMEEILEQSLSNEDDKSFEKESEIEEDDRNEEKDVLNEWISSMKKKVASILEKEIGDDLNPRYSPAFFNRLLKQLPTIPLWSSICRDKFGYGRVPSSSAAVELEFKTLKNQILIDEKRVDVALEKIVEYYDGKMKIIDCALQQKEQRAVNRERVHHNNDLVTLSDVIDNEIPHDLIDTTLDKSEFQNSNEFLRYFEDGIENNSALQNSALASSTEKERSPLKDLFSDMNIEKSTCIACRNGNFASGAHICAICQSKVHLLEGCSIAFQGEEEGYGEKRLCIPCSRSSTQSTRCGLNEIENWRGLGQATKKKKTAYYLTKNNQDLNDVIISEKLRKLPIIKNGNDQSLGLVTFGSTKFSLTNTCPVDSIFQILLAAATDNERILQLLTNNKASNKIFSMVLDVAKGKIQQTTYQKRLQIYLDYWKKTLPPAPNTIQSVNGACNVVSLANHLFKNCASFQEKSECQSGCPARIKYLPSITITEKEIPKSLSEVLKDHLALSGSRCQNGDCGGIENTEIYRIGDITIIGVDMDRPTALGTFSKSYICPKTKELYKILGVVEYRGNVVRRSQTELGHYIAITRRNSNWVAYDDRQKQSYSVRDSHQLTAELLFYSKL